MLGPVGNCSITELTVGGARAVLRGYNRVDHALVT
jgi:hypothetical protein